MSALPGLLYEILHESATAAHITKIGILRRLLAQTDAKKYASPITTAVVLAKPAAFIARPLVSSRIVALFSNLNASYKLDISRAQMDGVVDWVFDHIDLLRRTFRNLGETTKANTDPAKNFTRQDWDSLFKLFTVAQLQRLTLILLTG